MSTQNNGDPRVIPIHFYEDTYMMNKQPIAYTELVVKIKGESDKALLVDVYNDLDEVIHTCWFPISQMKSISRAAPGTPDLDTIQLADWLIDKNGLRDKL